MCVDGGGNKEARDDDGADGPGGGSKSMESARVACVCGSTSLERATRSLSTRWTHPRSNLADLSDDSHDLIIVFLHKQLCLEAGNKGDSLLRRHSR